MYLSTKPSKIWWLKLNKTEKNNCLGVCLSKNMNKISSGISKASLNFGEGSQYFLNLFFCSKYLLAENYVFSLMKIVSGFCLQGENDKQNQFITLSFLVFYRWKIIPKKVLFPLKNWIINTKKLIICDVCSLRNYSLFLLCMNMHGK